MLYWATSGFDVAKTTVSGGAELPEPQASDARLRIRPADRHNTACQFLKTYPQCSRKLNAGESSAFSILVSSDSFVKYAVYTEARFAASLTKFTPTCQTDV